MAIDVDYAAEKSARRSVAVTTAAPTMPAETGPTPFIHYPVQSKFYSFIFIVAKYINNVLSNFNVIGDGSCGFHAIIKRILRHIANYPEDTD